jgi:ABC-2 type transport system ATP-binding protein
MPALPALPPLPALIEVQGVAKRYSGADAPALDGVSLSIAEGSIFGLLGPNGAGKTTLISILLGLARKDRGTVRIGACDLDRDVSALRRQCGLAPQDLGFYPMLTVEENLSFYAGAGGLSGAAHTAQVDFACDVAQLSAHRGKRADRLSGGLKRRLNLALSLLHSPNVLVLDEPTVGVDPQSRAFILATIRKLRDERGLTVIYTSHYMEEVQALCDRIAILDAGRVLAEGSMADLMALPAAAGGRDLEDLFLALTHRRLRD